jgi:hypothetical protein
VIKKVIKSFIQPAPAVKKNNGFKMPAAVIFVVMNWEATELEIIATSQENIVEQHTTSAI